MRRPQRLNTFVESAVIGQEIEIDCEEAQPIETLISWADLPQQRIKPTERP